MKPAHPAGITFFAKAFVGVPGYKLLRLFNRHLDRLNIKGFRNGDRTAVRGRFRRCHRAKAYDT